MLQVDSDVVKNPSRHRLLKNEKGKIINQFGDKFMLESEEFEQDIAESGYELLKYASLH
jgi:hypothetical protein